MTVVAVAVITTGGEGAWVKDKGMIEEGWGWGQTENEIERGRDMAVVVEEVEVVVVVWYKGTARPVPSCTITTTQRPRSSCATCPPMSPVRN